MHRRFHLLLPALLFVHVFVMMRKTLGGDLSPLKAMLLIAFWRHSPRVAYLAMAASAEQPLC